jgi:predicted O-linked N-acetylglucosamine transferase (SPINDLY family)
MGDPKCCVDLVADALSLFLQNQSVQIFWHAILKHKSGSFFSLSNLVEKGKTDDRLRLNFAKHGLRFEKLRLSCDKLG